MSKFKDNNKLHTKIVDVIIAILFIAFMFILLGSVQGCDNPNAACTQNEKVVVEIVCEDNGNGATVCKEYSYCVSQD